MSKRRCRRVVALVAVVVGLLGARPAVGQVALGPVDPPERGGLLNNMAAGRQYDIMNQAHAEKQLDHVQARLRRDVERCNAAGAERATRRIQSLRYRIVVDRWLIRQNSLVNPGCYPYPLREHPISAAAIAPVPPPADRPLSRQRGHSTFLY